MQDNLVPAAVRCVFLQKDNPLSIFNLLKTD